MNKANIEDIYRLTPLQQGMLFHSLYEPEAEVGYEQMSCRLEGELDVASFARAWSAVVQRHTILRTAFVWEGVKEPLQVVSRHVELPLQQEDWRDEINQEQRLREFLKTERERGIDLSKAPLMRLSLLRLADKSYQLVWSRHHLLLDGWSRPLLMQEVLRYYDAFRHREQLALSPARPYREYIAWLQKQDQQAAERYWRDQLQGLQQATELVRSVGRERAVAADEERYGHVTRHLSTHNTPRLEIFCREQKLTMNTVLQGAWAVLLSRYVGQEEVTYGAVVAGRPAELAGVEQMVGLFINTLPVRVQVAGDERVSRWLQQLQAAQVEMRQYEYSSLAQIQGWSSVNGRLFDSIFVFENFPTSDYLSEAGSELRITSAEILAERSGYPVTLIAERRQQLTLQLRYDRCAFDERTIERLLSHFENALLQIVANPEQRVGDLSLLSDAERRQLIVDWNDTAVAYEEAYLPELITAQAEQSADAVAIVIGDEQFTYAELNERANQLGHYLRSRGVGPEVCVGLCVERSLEMMVGVLGILKAGGAYVPLEPTYPQERLQFMVADAGVALVLTQEKHRAQLSGCEVAIVSLDAQWPEIAVHCRENFPSGVSGENLAYVIYTSGSTGQPKGAMNRQAGLSNRLQWMQEAYQLTGADHVMQKTPYTFDVSVWELLWPLQTGARLVLAAPEGHRDRDYLLNEIERQEITFLHFVPSMLKVFVAGKEVGERCRSVRCIVSSGEALSAELLGEVNERLRTRLENLYGPTEAAIDVTVWSCEARADGKVPIGKPISNTELYVLDRAQELVPVGVKGELYLGGAGLARGYLGRPDLTAEKFVPHSFSDGARLYRTGDVVRYLADAHVEYLGRADSQVKIRGFRIELGEVEAVLNEHEGISQAVVMIKEQRLVAYVAPQNGSGSSEWREYLQKRLPEYMVPAVFVPLDSLPLSANGKVDKKALPDPVQSATEGETARTPTEELLCGIWSEVLNRAETGVNQNFFELGGHSLLATQVLSRIQTVFQIELPLRTLFEAPTVRQLAAHVEAGGVNVIPPLKRVSRDEPLPLSFAQQRLWFLAELEPDSAFYNSPLAVRLKGELQLSALEQTLTALLKRHEALRTSFVTEQGKPRQVINEVPPTALEVIDLSDRSESEREAAVRDLAARESSQPFDLGRGPLLRLKVARLSEQEHVLFLTMHHIVSDGWSMGVLIKEVSELYSAYATGREPELRELTIQYADYASWQREWLQGEVLEEQMKYWLEQLEDAPEVLELPTDRVRPTVQTFRGAQEKFALDEETSAALSDLSRREGVTMFMLLLAAFQLLLMRYSGQDDVVVGTPVAARRHKEVEDLIGFFVNTLVLRTNLSGDPTFKELLKRVREVCLGAYSHQDVPFEKLVEELQPKRNLDVPPLVQVALGLQNGPQVTANLAGLQTSLLNPEHETVRYDLTVWVMEGATTLHFLWTYNADLFEAHTIRLLARRFGTLLRNIVDHPAERISALEMVAETEKTEEKEITNRIVEKLVRTQRKAIQVPKQVVVYEQRSQYKDRLQ